MSDESKSKPEPIRVNMSGIEPEPIIMGGDEPPHLLLDWASLLALPPYQTFLSELCSMPFDTVDDWLEHQTQALIVQHGEMPFFDMYKKWHSEKPYWKNETPWGGLKDASNTDQAL